MFSSKKNITIKLLLFSFFLGLAAFLYFSPIHADQDLITLFPIENYNQNLSDWMAADKTEVEEVLLSPAMQQHHMATFYNHYFGTLSPWDARRVNQILHQTPPNDLKTIEQSILQHFAHPNPDTLGYGVNFRPYTAEWIDKLAANIDLSQLESSVYQAAQRAIAIDNLQARILPTEDVYFYNYKLAGQGYPFDNLQISSIWVGTPLYVLAKTRDHSWSLVLTPDFIGWVKTQGLAYTSESFTQQWKTAAKKNLAAIVRSQTTLFDEAGHFRVSAYIGSVFPADVDVSHLKLFIPVANPHHQAFIQYSLVSHEQAVLMPYAASLRHFSQLLNALIGRPYGWGGMYFYNDCSAELKNLFTAFGIWLPRHSSAQVYAGKWIDLSNATPAQRLTYLMSNGHRFLTIVYVDSHVFMYVGNYPNPNDSTHTPVALSYQNLWSLRPDPPIRRAVIGKAVLFPLLLQYPEDSSLTSLVNRKYFQVTYLDELPNEPMKLEQMDLKGLMSLG